MSFGRALGSENKTSVALLRADSMSVCVCCNVLFPGWFLISETTSIYPQAVPLAVPPLSLSSTLCLSGVNDQSVIATETENRVTLCELQAWSWVNLTIQTQGLLLGKNGALLSFLIYLYLASVGLMPFGTGKMGPVSAGAPTTGSLASGSGGMLSCVPSESFS